MLTIHRTAAWQTCLLALILLSGSPASSQTQVSAAAAINFSSTDNWGVAALFCLGFEFDAVEPFDVTALGVYDEGKDGLVQSHRVGIFGANGTLLVSATVTENDPLRGFFRYHDIPAFRLMAGTGYRIVALGGSDPITWNPKGFKTDSRVRFVRDRYEGNAASLVFPTRSDNLIGQFGANFLLSQIRILTAPRDQIISEGSNATFSVLVTNAGSRRVSYQWQFNGTNIAGANAAILTVTNPSTAQAGVYTVLIGDAPQTYLLSASASLAFSILELNRYAGVTIKGRVGGRYRIEFASSIAPPITWMTLTNIESLAVTPYLFIDFDSVIEPKRFYRVVTDENR